MVLFQILGWGGHPHRSRHTLYLSLCQVKKYNDKRGGGVLNIQPPPPQMSACFTSEVFLVVHGGGGYTVLYMLLSNEELHDGCLW